MAELSRDQVARGQKAPLYNPFSGNKVLMRGGRRPIFRAFFRCMPLQRWSLGQIQAVFEYVAVEPSRFGFPPAATCVVNTAHLLPSARSRASGVYVFGSERGCKSIIIPSSCDARPFDRLDVKMLEPIFRWNPGATYIYLSLECQSVAHEIAAHLAKMRNINDITLEGWSDPIAIHKVMLACKNVELLDAYSIEDPPREWQSEAGVQALSTLIEMHPKLRGVCATRNYLNDWQAATSSSRCKHNVAMIPFGDDYLLIYYMLWAFGFWVVCWFLAGAAHTYVYVPLLEGKKPLYAESLWMLTLAGLFGAVMIGDIVLTPHYGRGWTRLVKHYILMARFWALRRQGSALVAAPTTAGAAGKGAASAAAVAAKARGYNADQESFLSTRSHERG